MCVLFSWPALVQASKIETRTLDSSMEKLVDGKVRPRWRERGG